MNALISIPTHSFRSSVAYTVAATASWLGAAGSLIHGTEMWPMFLSSAAAFTAILIAGRPRSG